MLLNHHLLINKCDNYTNHANIHFHLPHVALNRRKLGATPEPISGLARHNPYSLNLQRCETGDSIGLFCTQFRPLNAKEIFKCCSLDTHGANVLRMNDSENIHASQSRINVFVQKPSVDITSHFADLSSRWFQQCRATQTR